MKDNAIGALHSGSLITMMFKPGIGTISQSCCKRGGTVSLKISSAINVYRLRARWAYLMLPQIFPVVVMGLETSIELQPQISPFQEELRTLGGYKWVLKVSNFKIEKLNASPDPALPYFHF
uniref:Uncharacterized protein n=1 Tax=Solanum lycopersicum TaxID=4081 RepID=A0A3Q7F975_SOLLC